ncbi:MAG: hypothetical protein V1854_04075 [Methanobacteriota archaeon]
MTDDGVGIHAVLKLREMKFQSDVEVFDAGTDAFYTLEAMDGKDKAIILDACKGNFLINDLRLFEILAINDVGRVYKNV